MTFTVPQQLEAVIHRFNLRIDPDWEKDGRPAPIPAAYFRGWTIRDSSEFDHWCSEHLPQLFTCMDDWSDGYRSVWTCATLKAMLTYCEGDLDLTIDETDEAYVQRFHSAREFYAKY